ncbi:MAG: hypothetical protein FD180_557 [Planctomycetota bacterium]|nr:MAG: hypothetical protein FD180_557 [Planctomycetota bacterium]
MPCQIRGKRDSLAVEITTQSFGQLSGVKIDEKSRCEFGEMQVGQDLGFVHINQFLNSFEFENQTLFDEQVNPVASSIVTPLY